MMTWSKLADQYFKWWQDAASPYLALCKEQPYSLKNWGGVVEQSLQFKKMADQLMDETWRHFRLPCREEVTGLHDRLNHLESLLLDLKERDLAEEVDARILKRGRVASPEDLKSLEKTLNELEDRIADASELGRVKEAVTHLGAKLDSLTEQTQRIREMLAQSGSKLDTSSAGSKKPTKKPAKRASGGAK